MRFRALSDAAFWFDARPPTSDMLHRFCGAHEASGAECPNCRRPLLRILEIDARDERLGLPVELGRLPLFFCWRCNLAQKPLQYRVLGAHSIELLDWGEGGVEEDFPYEGYPEHFSEQGIELSPVGAEESALVQNLNLGRVDPWSLEASQRESIHRPRHQIGGEPWLAQPWADLRCVSCGADLRFLAAVADEAPEPRGFTGNEGVQMLFRICERCRVIGAEQACD